MKQKKVSLLVVGCVVFSILLLYYFQIDIVGLVNVISPLLTGLGGLGTLVLAFLYYKQHGEIQRQTKLQRKLIEATHQPVIEFLDYDPIYGGFLSVHLRNVGNGVATDFQGRIHLYIPSDQIEYSTDYCRMGLIATSDIEDVDSSIKSEISTLSPGERDRLAAEMYGPSVSDDSRVRGFPSEFFDEDEEKEVYFQVEISFDHLMKTKGRGRKYLNPRKNEVSGSGSVSVLLSDSEKVPHEDCRSDIIRPRGTIFDSTPEVE